MATPHTNQAIVLARVDTEYVAAEPRRRTRGERPVMRQTLRPVACVWSHRSAPDVLDNARACAARDGFGVFVYQNVTRAHAFAQAKRDALEALRRSVETKQAKQRPGSGSL